MCIASATWSNFIIFWTICTVPILRLSLWTTHSIYSCVSLIQFTDSKIANLQAKQLTTQAKYFIRETSASRISIYSKCRKNIELFFLIPFRLWVLNLPFILVVSENLFTVCPFLKKMFIDGDLVKSKSYGLQTIVSQPRKFSLSSSKNRVQWGVFIKAF